MNFGLVQLECRILFSTRHGRIQGIHRGLHRAVLQHKQHRHGQRVERTVETQIGHDRNLLLPAKRKEAVVDNRTVEIDQLVAIAMREIDDISVSFGIVYMPVDHIRSLYTALATCAQQQRQYPIIGSVHILRFLKNKDKEDFCSFPLDCPTILYFSTFKARRKSYNSPSSWLGKRTHLPG